MLLLPFLKFWNYICSTYFQRNISNYRYVELKTIHLSSYNSNNNQRQLLSLYECLTSLLWFHTGMRVKKTQNTQSKVTQNNADLYNFQIQEGDTISLPASKKIIPSIYNSLCAEISYSPPSELSLTPLPLVSPTLFPVYILKWFMRLKQDNSCEVVSTKLAQWKTTGSSLEMTLHNFQLYIIANFDFT